MSHLSYHSYVSVPTRTNISITHVSEIWGRQPSGWPARLFQMWHVLHSTSLTSKNMKYTHTHITPGGHLRGLGSDRRGQLHLLWLCAFWGTWMLHMARKPLWTANRWFSWQARSFFTFLLLQEVFANLKLPWGKPTFWGKFCAFHLSTAHKLNLESFILQFWSHPPN